MALALVSGDQPSDKDNWDNGRLARKRQLIVEQGLPHSYGVKAQGVNNNKDAIGLVAFGAKFGLMI
ncbi:hypothetical protein Gotri_006787 [Gossypium trilobum]|uniref:Uncharacterized protein n=1 Tax=Gossypium trilobum TaxID=34281 RepID=A0A7J9FQJ7_9ROSI|nr:hypothetical protein [Gossypium trilobum]